MPKIATKVSIAFGDGVAVIRREGTTTAIVAKVLGRELQVVATWCTSTG